MLVLGSVIQWKSVGSKKKKKYVVGAANMSVMFGLFFSTGGIWRSFTWSYIIFTQNQLLKCSFQHQNVPNLSLNEIRHGWVSCNKGFFSIQLLKSKSPLTNAKHEGKISHPSINPSNQPPTQANRKHSLASSVPGVFLPKDLDQHLQTKITKINKGGWDPPWVPSITTFLGSLESVIRFQIYVEKWQVDFPYALTEMHWGWPWLT